MTQFAELGIDFKSGIIFSVSALVLSILAGLSGSVPAGMIFFRSIIITPVFFAVGFGIMQVIKKFVPEIYEILSSVKVSSEESTEKVDISFDSSEETGDEGFEKKDSGFSEFTEKDYDRLQSVKDSDLDGELNLSGGKLGKHIIVENQLNSYEPKLMAQAIRTMMSKDKD